MPCLKLAVYLISVLGVCTAVGKSATVISKLLFKYLFQVCHKITAVYHVCYDIVASVHGITLMSVRNMGDQGHDTQKQINIA